MDGPWPLHLRLHQTRSAPPFPPTCQRSAMRIPICQLESGCQTDLSCHPSAILTPGSALPFEDFQCACRLGQCNFDSMNVGRKRQLGSPAHSQHCRQHRVRLSSKANEMVSTRSGGAAHPISRSTIRCAGPAHDSLGSRPCTPQLTPQRRTYLCEVIGFRGLNVCARNFTAVFRKHVAAPFRLQS